MVANHYQVTLDCFAIIARPSKRYVALTAQLGYVVACTSVVKTSVLNWDSSCRKGRPRLWFYGFIWPMCRSVTVMLKEIYVSASYFFLIGCLIL